MDLATVTDFFLWSTILNAAILAFMSFFLVFAPELTYRTQRKFVPLSREQFNVAIYCFVGGFKLLFLFFSLVPFLVLKFLL